MPRDLTMIWMPKPNRTILVGLLLLVFTFDLPVYVRDLLDYCTMGSFCLLVSMWGFDCWPVKWHK